MLQLFINQSWDLITMMYLCIVLNTMFFILYNILELGTVVFIFNQKDYMGLYFGGNGYLKCLYFG